MSDENGLARDRWRLLRSGEIAPEDFRAFLAKHGLTPADIGVDSADVDREEVLYNRYVRA